MPPWVFLPGVGDILCYGKPDGQYPIRDTFKYVKCTNGNSQIVTCPANQVYIYREKRCRTVTLADQSTNSVSFFQIRNFFSLFHFENKSLETSCN